MGVFSPLSNNANPSAQAIRPKIPKRIQCHETAQKPLVKEYGISSIFLDLSSIFPRSSSNLKSARSVLKGVIAMMDPRRNLAVCTINVPLSSPSRSQNPLERVKGVVSKRVVLAGIPLYRNFLQKSLSLQRYPMFLDPANRNEGT